MKDKKKPPSGRGDETVRFEAEVKRVSERLSQKEPPSRSQGQPKPERSAQGSRDTAREPGYPDAPKDRKQPETSSQDTGDSATKSSEPATSKDPSQTNLQREQLQIARKGWRISITGIVLQAMAVVLAAAGIAIALVGIWPKLTKIQLDVKRNQLLISSPQDRAEVGSGQKIRGQTPYSNLYHYIVVTLVRTGDLYVQKEPAHVAADRTFSGEARFDDMPVTQDDELKIQILATSSLIPPGKLNLVTSPEDAISSEPITVRWVQALAGQIVMNAPTEGADVDFSDKIVGRTSYPYLNHYIVVTPVKTRTALVQDLKATVNSADGNFTGTARFGGVGVGVGEQFIIGIIATQSTLAAGPLIREPGDAIRSNTITVRRRK